MDKHHKNVLVTRNPYRQGWRAAYEGRPLSPLLYKDNTKQRSHYERGFYDCKHERPFNP